MNIILEKTEDRVCLCGRCGLKLGAMKDRYWVTARHLRVFNWQVTVSFWREKRWCENCKKVRSEMIEFICPVSPHITMELAWWISSNAVRLSLPPPAAALRGQLDGVGQSLRA